jgi:replicative DNA helicase
MERSLSGSSNVMALRGSDTPTRVPPHNYEAEQALLGAILANNRVFDKVNEFLRKEHFADPLHGRIYDAAGTLIQRGQIANFLTLRNLFDQDPALVEAGGAKYLARLENAVVTIINAEDYGHTIHDLFLRRELINLGEEVVNEAFAYDLDLPAMEQIESAEQRLYQLAETGQIEGVLKPLKDAMTSAILIAEQAFKRDSHVTGVTTGLHDLDRKLGGLHDSDLVILAARPSMGKTALATNIAFSAAKAYREERDEIGNVKVLEGAKVAFFSLEMSAEQLATRILSEQTSISSDRIRRGEVREEDFPKFVAAAQQLTRLPFFIDDTPGLSVPALRTRARRLKRQHGLGLIVVDYLQLIRSVGASRSENRVQELSEITRSLKGVAKELGVPVLALSQLSRAVEQREDKRPQLADLRESGSIEQDADVVMFIYRPHWAKLDSSPEERDQAEIQVAKQRNGPTDKVRFVFRSRLTRFEEAAPDAFSQFAPDDM